MGIVPDDCVASMTVGRDAEVETLQQWLSQNAGAALLVGDYGSGKSHLLRYLSLKALEQNYAVAQVQIDPNETPFHKPKRVYRGVTLTLQYRPPGESQTKGFRDLVLGSLAGGTLKDHKYFGRLLDRSASVAQYEEMFWDWIEASEEDVLRPIDWQEDYWGNRYNRFRYVPPIYPHMKAANMICYLLSGLAWAATHALGLRGFVICIDEAESMDVSASSSQINKGVNFLRAIARVASDDQTLLETPSSTGLIHSRMGVGRQIPFLYRPECGLRLVFGFTPTPLLRQIAELQSAFRLDLEPLDEAALVTLFGWVRDHYARAYGLEVSYALSDLQIDRLLRVMENTRSFAKGCVEILDLSRAETRQNRW